MNATSRGSAGQQRGAQRGDWGGGRRRALGWPDPFVYAPVAAILLTAVITATIAQSLPVGLALVAVAVVLTLVDAWLNR
ncbi:hypothetical protein [Nocardia terpenica]|uniref:Uncharacterized protein n=1 Tax=Nocardia terpenica TaxID=455432 RepID=A0A291RTE9_9NOCA|nr:hypothetical protein [Nocardia terpenica]ATL70512.1 hypothetical protein CRH09_34370 [Nocardia terpenica]